jgi:hypothetical protein
MRAIWPRARMWRPRIPKDGPNPELGGRRLSAYLDRFDTSASRTEMQQNLAETLLASRRYYEAGRAYEEVASQCGQHSRI